MNKKMISPVMGCVLSLTLGVLALVWPQKPSAEPQASVPASSALELHKNKISRWNQILQNRLPGSQFFIQANNHLSLLISGPKIDQVFCLKDRLVENIGAANPITARRNTEAVNQFVSRYGEDIPIYFSLVPSAQEVYREQMPDAPNVLDQTSFITNIYGDSKQNTSLSSNNSAYSKTAASDYGALQDVSAIDVHTALLANQKQDLYYHTDSNWTSLGAYTAYGSLVTSMGLSAISSDSFNIEHVQYDYLGNLYQKTLVRKGSPDRIDLYTYAPNTVIDRVIRYEGTKSQTSSSMYYYETLNTPNAMDVFLGQDCGVTKIHTTIDTGQDLLLFGDEYAKPLLQFLSLHYRSITFVNLSKYTDDQASLIKPADYDTILFLYQVKNYISDISVAARLPNIGETENS
ncbi:hypothetical protein H8702_07395 [Massilimaliae timonensis]|uniref:Uncharacterized protein n=1 Tax=Massiliimalia timonensis TaxID=1987501 RepID=A0A8J6TZ79_9FIRM|nr:DHHW family protein [Massiliimalia timonensis]MBC8610947.1 hypothetical protein [Massiliimalia timonensis]